MKLTQYDSEEGMASFLGKYNDPCRRPLAQEHGKAGAGWCSSALSQLAESSGGPRKVLGVSRTPDVWSQRQMDEEVDKAGENRRLLWRSRKHSTRGLWSADGALQATRKPRLEAPLAHMFQGAGSKGIKLRRRHAARQGEWPEPALGSSVR